METNLREHRHRTLPEAIAAANDAVLCHTGGASPRILLVDDSRDDRAFTIRELTKEFPNLSIVEAGDMASLEQSFSSTDGFDLLITDYQMFWSDGLSVVSRAKERWPEMPVIMFTGTGNEEVAVQAMKSGAYDYVLKTPRHYDRLNTAVRGALEKNEHNRNLAAAEARYTMLFDTVPVGLFRATPQGRILDINPAFAAILEIDRESLVGLDFAELHPREEDFQHWREQLEREGSVAWVESRVRTFTGKIRWVKIHAKALRDPSTHEIIYEGSVEDVTRAKEAEAEREDLIEKLQSAVGKVRTLTGLLPICSSCKKIRDDNGRWNMLESFIEDHSHAHFTHSFCPDCARRLYPEVFLDTPKF